MLSGSNIKQGGCQDGTVIAGRTGTGKTMMLAMLTEVAGSLRNSASPARIITIKKGREFPVKNDDKK